MEKYCRTGQATDNIWRMRFACWITKATDTHSENVILIAFPTQQWFHVRASVLLYMYIVCLVTLYSMVCPAVLLKSVICLFLLCLSHIYTYIYIHIHIHMYIYSTNYSPSVSSVCMM